MLHIHYTNSIVHNEDGPNIFMFGDKDDWKEFLLDIRKLLDQDTNIIEITEDKYDISGSNKLILERNDYISPLIKSNHESIHIVFSIDMWESFNETITELSSKYCFDYIEFDDKSIQQDANFIVESSSRAEEMAKVTP